MQNKKPVKESTSIMKILISLSQGNNTIAQIEKHTKIDHKLISIMLNQQIVKLKIVERQSQKNNKKSDLYNLNSSKWNDYLCNLFSKQRVKETSSKILNGKKIFPSDYPKNHNEELELKNLIEKYVKMLFDAESKKIIENRYNPFTLNDLPLKLKNFAFEIKRYVENYKEIRIEILDEPNKLISYLENIESIEEDTINKINSM